MKNILVLLCCAVPLLAQSYTIVGPADPKPYEQTAVQELKDYLGKRIDGSLKIGDSENVTFYVGDTEFAAEKGLQSASLEDEQWVLKSFGDKIVVNGGGTRGALYAVYHFLEDYCDIHWWSEFEEYVPEAGPLSVPVLDVKKKPVFAYRNIYRGTRNKNGNRYMIRVRQNGDSAQQIPKEFGGCFFYGPPDHCHTFDWYVPAKKYLATHPEYFSLVGGKRRGGMGEGQLCLTNPDLKKIFIENLFKYIEQGYAKAKELGVPAPRIYDVSQNDNRAPCECENCKAFVEKHNQSGLILSFVNDIAAEVEKKYPELYISTLAYHYSELPPKGGIRARKNVIVKLTNTTSNKGRSILDEQNKYFKEFVEAWKHLADNVYIWEYSITFTKNLTGMPYASELYYDDLHKHYVNNNVTGLFVEHECPEQADMFEMKFFLETKLMEDPYQDLKALTNLFMDKYYGAAAPFMHKYRQAVNEACLENDGQLRWSRSIDTFDYLTDDRIEQCQKIFDAAVQAVSGDELLVERVMRARNGLDRLTCIRTASLSYHGPERPAASKLNGVPALERLEKYWPKWCERYDNATQLKKNIADTLNAFKYALKPLPPPEQFKDRTYYDFIAVCNANAGYDTHGIAAVNDPDSPVGRVYRVNVPASHYYSMPFVIGFYDEQRELGVKKEFDKIPENKGYNWYTLDETVKIPEDGYVYVTRAWTIQLHLRGLKELVGKEFEVWLSAKHTGEQFHPDQKGAEERIMIDRILLVEPQKK